MPIFMKLSYVAGRFNPEMADLKIEEISPLDSKVGNIANAVLVHIPKDYANPEFFSQLKELQGDKRPGELFFEIRDPETKQTIRLRARKRIPLTRDFVDIMEKYHLKYKISTINN